MSGPRIEFNPLEPRISRGEGATFSETYDASRTIERFDELTAETRLNREIYDPLQGFINETLRPMAPDFFSYGIEQSARNPSAPPISLSTWQRLQDEEFAPSDDTLAQLLAELDDAEIPYPAEITVEALSARREELRAAAVGEYRDAEETLSRGGTGAMLAGQFVGALDNFETLATLPISMPARAGILATAVFEGGLTAATEVATTPIRNQFLRDLGLPEQSMLQNALFGAVTGAAVGGGLRGIQVGAERIGRLFSPQDMRGLSELARQSTDAEVRAMGEALAADLDAADAVGAETSRAAAAEHAERVEQGRLALESGTEPAMPDQPSVLRPVRDTPGGQLERLDPTELGLDEAPARGQEIDAFDADRAGVVIAFEDLDGNRIAVDGRSRAQAAQRDGAAEVTARVFREEDGLTIDDVRAVAREMQAAADATPTRAMSGINRLDDDAFDIVANNGIGGDIAVLVARSLEDTDLHYPMIRAIQRAGISTVEEAEALITELAPTLTPASLVAPPEARAKVLDRAQLALEEDDELLSTLREIDNRANGREADAPGSARQDAELVRNLRAAITRDQQRGGALTEAIENAAEEYARTGRLGDAASRLVSAIRDLTRSGEIDGRGNRLSQRGRETQAQAAQTPDPNASFDNPLDGEGVRAQLAATPLIRGEADITPDNFDGTLESVMDVKDIRMPIDETLPNDQVRAQIQRLTNENREIVGELMEAIDRRFGTESGDNVKDLSKVTQKAQRPSILAKKPWHTVAHIRDTYRFKTSLERLDDVSGIFDMILERGIEIVKIDTKKLFSPGEWGWRIIAFDLRMKNGQIVEYYLPLTELEIEKKAKGHLIFEEWRNKTPEQIAAQQQDYLAAIHRSFTGYDQAFRSALDRMGLSPEEAEASWIRTESSLREAARKSSSSPGMTISSGRTSPGPRQTPSSVRDNTSFSDMNRSARGVPSSTRANGSDISSTSAQDISPNAARANTAEPTNAARQQSISNTATEAPARADGLDGRVAVGVEVIDGQERVITMTRAELQEELELDENFAQVLSQCVI
jgi:hypothetical protein